MKTPYSVKGSRTFLSGILSLLFLAIASPGAIAQVENSELEPIYQLIEQHLYLQAEQELGIHLEQNRQDAEAWQLLGTARQGRWDFKKAAEAYQRALGLGRENAPLLRGWIYSEGRSLSKVSLFFGARRLKKAAERALKLDPYSVETRAALAVYYYFLPRFFGGSKKKASRLAEELVELSPASGYYLMGVRAKEEGKPDSVTLDYWSKALEYNPEHTSTLRDLGLYWIENGAVDEGINYYRRAVEAGPDDPTIYLSYARGLRRADMHDSSAVQFKKALQIDPFLAPARLNLAEYYERVENSEAAIEHYWTLAINNPAYMTREIEKRLGELIR